MSAKTDTPASAVCIRTLRQSVSQQLSDISDSPQLDADLMLCKILNWTRARLIARDDEPLNNDQHSDLMHLLAARRQGQPMAYLLGEQEFWSLTLTVTPDVLVPRPDTEELVAWALETACDDARVLDLGTGSGAIAIAIASEKPHWRLAASDASADALQVARSNAKRHHCNIEWRQGSWLEPWSGERFDLILSNPPYLADDDPHLPSLMFEPQSALVAADQGLADFAAIIHAAPEHLVAKGWLAVEHGLEQAELVRHMFHDAGFAKVGTRQDLAGRDRISFGQKP